MRRLSVFSLMLLMVLPVHALDLSDEEEELLEIVEEAFDALHDLDGYSVHLELSMVLEFTISVGRSVETLSLELEQGGEFEFADEDFAGTVDVTYVIEGAGVDDEIEITADIVVIDDELYIRVTDVSPRRREREFSDDWISYSDDPDDAVFAYVVPTTFLQLANVGRAFSPLVLASVNERAGYAEDSEALRIFELEFEEDAIAAAVEANLGISAEELDVDADEFAEELAEGTELILTVWVNEEEGLPYRVEEELLMEATLEIQGSDVELEAEFTSTQVYDDFGEEFEIEEPDVD